MVGRISEIDRINERIGQLHKRLQGISEMEADSAPSGGLAAKGFFDPERQRIISETDALLDEWQKLLGP